MGAAGFAVVDKNLSVEEQHTVLAGKDSVQATLSVRLRMLSRALTGTLSMSGRISSHHYYRRIRHCQIPAPKRHSRSGRCCTNGSQLTSDASHHYSNGLTMLPAGVRRQEEKEIIHLQSTSSVTRGVQQHRCSTRPISR